MFQLYIFVKKSRTTLSQIQLFNTSRCKSVIPEYTFYLSIAKNMHSSIVSWKFLTYSLWMFHLSNSNRIDPSNHLKTQLIPLDSSVETRIPIHPMCHLNHVFAHDVSILLSFRLKILLSIRSFPSWMLGTPGKRRKNDRVQYRSVLQSNAKLTRTRS